MLELRRLRLLRELDRLGSIAAVADALAFTPSAVSQQLTQLERETAVQLIDRSGRSSRLTPAARTLLEPIETVLTHLDEAESLLARMTSDPTTAVVRLASFQTVALRLLPRVISRLSGEIPGLHVQVVESEAERSLPALIEGKLDLVIFDDYITNPRPAHAGIDRQELCSDRLLVALPQRHPLARSDFELAELADDRWILELEDTAYSPAIEHLCSEHGHFLPRIAHRANSVVVILAFVQAGHGVTIVPEMVEPEYADVVLRPIGKPAFTRSIHTAVRSGMTRHPAIVAVREALAKECALRVRARAPVRAAIGEPVKI